MFELSFVINHQVDNAYVMPYHQTQYTQNQYIKANPIENVINEIKNISEYEIESYYNENIDNEMIALGIKFKNFPKDINKVAYSIELMNKLDEKLPDNIDIFVI